MIRQKTPIASAVFGLILSLLGAPFALAGNLIVDGSFENPVVPVGSFLNFNPGDSIGGAWTVLGSTPGSPAVNLVQTTYNEPFNNNVHFPAEDGLNSLDLTGPSNTGPNSGVQQIVSTIAGQGYDLSFYVGVAAGAPVYSTPSTVDLSINGGASVGYTNANLVDGTVTWELFTTTFIATASTTTITFLNGDSTNNFNGLDNVQLVTASAVPEPSTLVLLACGLPTIVGVFRSCCRKRNAS